jgi:hypothetical protein
MGGTCRTNGGKMKTYSLLVRKPKGKRCRWINNIKGDVLVIKLGGVGWVGLA